MPEGRHQNLLLLMGSIKSKITKDENAVVFCSQKREPHNKDNLPLSPQQTLIFVDSHNFQDANEDVQTTNEDNSWLNKKSSSSDTEEFWFKEDAGLPGSQGDYTLKSKKRLLAVVPNDYEVVKTLDQDSHSKVVHARKKSDQRDYCIKVFSKRHILEVKQVTMLHLPYVIDTIEMLEDSRNSYVVSAYVKDGISLKEVLDNTNLSQDVCVLFAAEIILTLEEIHKLGKVYRDLRPSKIMIDSHGHLSIIPPLDIKLDDLANEGSSSSNFQQCAEYLAPEILEGFEEEGPEADWWTLGVLLYQFFVGNTPFRGSHVNETVNKVLAARVKFPKDNDVVISAQLLIQSLLEKDPIKRQVSAVQIKEHPFFIGVDWHQVATREYKSPFWHSQQLSMHEDKDSIMPEITDTVILGSADDFIGYTFASPTKENSSQIT